MNRFGRLTRGVMTSLLAGALVLAAAGCGDDDPTSPPAPTPVDQAFEPGAADALVGIGQTGAWAQTFTVGRTGTLTAVDLMLRVQGTDDQFRVDIRGTTGGDPNLDDGAVAASRLVTALSLRSGPASFVTIDLGGGVPCVAGQTLAIVVIRVVGTGSSDVLWITENVTAEDYAGGTAVQRIGGSGTAWANTMNDDFYFRTRVLSP